MQSEQAAPQNIDSRSNGGKLEGNALSPGAIIFIVLAFAAPISVVVGSMPLAFAYGNGVGVPGTYLIAAIVLLCFVAGYAAMSRHVVNAGAFFAYITRGLGRRPGGAAAYVALLAYGCLTIALGVTFGYFAFQVVQQIFHFDLNWWVYSAAVVAIVGFLGYRSVDVAAKVLKTALILEVAIIGVFDVGVLVKMGASAFSLSAFSPSHIFSGQIGVGFVYCFLSYIGIEATAIFGEEARNPGRTIPRASYGAVILIGAVYVLSSWALLAAYGASHVQKAAASAPSTFAFGAAFTVLGKYPTDVMEILLVSSFFAVVLAAHNSTSRYMFSMGRARLLPAAVGRSHARWHSPALASVCMTTIAAITVAAVEFAGSDPYLSFGGPILALGTVGILALQAAASVAVFVFFRRIGDRRIWTTIVAPLLAAAGLITVIVLILENYGMVTGTQSAVLNNLPWIIVAAAVFGLGVVTYLKSRKPGAFEHLTDDGAEPEPVLDATPQVAD